MGTVGFSIIIIFLFLLIFYLLWVYATIFQAQKNILDVQKKLIKLAKERSSIILRFIESLKLQKDINPELCDKIITLGSKINDNTQDEASILVLENKLSKSFKEVVIVLKSNPKSKASVLIEVAEKDLNPIQKSNKEVQAEYKATITKYNEVLTTFPTKQLASLFGYKVL